MKRVFYTESSTGRAQMITVTKEGDFSSIIENDFLETNIVDSYAFFQNGKELSEDNLTKLNKIGVGSFIGVSSRLHSESLLQEFNATEEEISITKELMKLQ